jgi:hypothetical protein
MDTESDEPEAPVLRVITPDATPEEVAALVAVLSALGSGGSDQPRPRSEWGDPSRMHRRPLHPGPGGWRSSSLPH